MRLSVSSGSAVSGVSLSTYSTGMAMDRLKTVGSYLLLWAMLASCSKYKRVRE